MGAGCSTEKGKSVLLESIEDHTDSINCMALSEDGSLLATGSEDHTAMMWSTKTDSTECLGILKGHTNYVTCITVVDTFVITGSADATVRKWDMTTCDCIFNYTGHSSRISRVIATNDFIFSTSYDKTAKAWIFDWDDDDGSSDKACIRTLKGHMKGVYSIIYIPAEDMDMDNDEEELVINPGDMVITGSSDCTAKSWSLDTGSTIKTFKGHKGPITTMNTDPNGTTLYTGSQDKAIRAWSIYSGACLRVMEGHELPVLCLLVVNRLLYSGSQDGKVKCWVREFGDCTRTYKGHKHSIVAMRFHDGILYTASGDNCSIAFDAKSGSMKRMFKGHDGAVTCLAVVGEKLYTGSFDNTLKSWDISRIHEDPDEDEEYDGEVPEDFDQKQNQQLQALDNQLDSYVEVSNDVDLTSKPDLDKF